MAKLDMSFGLKLPNIPTLILKNLGFIAYCGFLAVLYIANTHYAEYNVRKLHGLREEVEVLQWTERSLRSENNQNSLRSEVVQSVRGEGLRLHRGRPKKIEVPASAEKINP
ncbi:MAG: FtsL-like putative cell division protein [Bacteroidota bacterium]